MAAHDNTQTSPTARQGGLKRFLFTEEGVVTQIALASAIFTYLSHDPGNNEKGFMSRRLLWLEPYFGDHYLSVSMVVLAMIMAVVTWIKQRK